MTTESAASAAPRPAPGWRRVAEAVTVGVLIVAGLWYGRFAFVHASSYPDYFYLGPAVMLGSGQGFRAPMPAPGSPLADFLTKTRDAIDANEAQADAFRPLDQLDYSAQYLYRVLGGWWSVAGVSWTAAGMVAGLFHAMAVVGVYGLLRLFTPVLVAALGALWMCTSTLQLSQIPHLRDYSKGAFITLALPFIVALLVRDGSRRTLLALAAGAGVVVGLGMGFKRDVFVLIPLATLCVFAFRGRRPWTALGEKLWIAGVLVGSFVIASGPILFPLVSGGSHTMHVILLGQSHEFNTPLGIESPQYDVVPFYNDGYVGMMVLGDHAKHADTTFAIPSQEYDEAGQRLWLAILRHLPADAVARALGAVDGILNLAFRQPDPTFLTRPPPAAPAFVDAYAWLARWNGAGALFGIALILSAAVVSVRLAAVAALLLLVLTAYPSLQFMVRHYFHLQFVPAFCAVVVAWAGVRLITRSLARPKATGPTGIPPGAFGRVAVAAVLLALVTLAPLYAARAYQGRHLEREIHAHLAASRDRLAPTVEATESGSRLLTWPQAADRSNVYLVEFEGDAAASLEVVDVGVRYRSPGADTDFSRIISVSPSAGGATAGFEALAQPGVNEFVGIELGPRAWARLAGVSRLASTGPAGLPLDLRLPADWPHRSLYQSLALEGAGSRAPRRVHCTARPGCAGLLAYVERLAAEPAIVPDAALKRVHLPMVSTAPGEIRVDGLVETESSYLFELQERAAAPGDAFLARGTIHEGGATIGLLRNNVWYRIITVSTRGPFIVVVPIDEAGVYTPLVTNAPPPGQRRNRLALTTATFMSPADDMRRPSSGPSSPAPR